VGVAVGAGTVGVGGAGVKVAVSGSGVEVGGTGVSVGVRVEGATTSVLVGVGSGVFVGGGTSVGAPVAVEVKVGCIVGSIVGTSVGVATGRVISRETIKNSTVKTNPLRKTKSPRMSKFLSFIPHSFRAATASIPLQHRRVSHPPYGITSAWPTEMALGLSRPLAWTISVTVTPYISAIWIKVSPGCTTWILWPTEEEGVGTGSVVASPVGAGEVIEGMSNTCPSRMALALSRLFAWTMASTVLPYMRAISLKVSPACTTWVMGVGEGTAVGSVVGAGSGGKVGVATTRSAGVKVGLGVLVAVGVGC